MPAGMSEERLVLATQALGTTKLITNVVVFKRLLCINRRGDINNYDRLI